MTQKRATVVYFEAKSQIYIDSLRKTTKTQTCPVSEPNIEQGIL
jgi:hypothetical protein